MDEHSTGGESSPPRAGGGEAGVVGRISPLSAGELMYESRSTRVYRLLDRGGTRFGGRTDHVAIKVLSSSSPPEPGRISRLYDEYILSRHLSNLQLDGVRSALRLRTKKRRDDVCRDRHRRGDEHHGEDSCDMSCHTLYLEWAPGVTLREWIDTRMNDRRIHEGGTVDNESGFIVLVRLALEIARCLSEIHEAGAVHNDFTSDNIIVDDAGAGGKEYVSGEDGDDADATLSVRRFSVKIIDFGSASLLSSEDGDSSAASSSSLHTMVSGRRGDLLSLGQVLYELFSGRRDPLRHGGCVDETGTTNGGSSSSITTCGDIDDMGGNDRARKTTRVEAVGRLTPLHELEESALPLGRVPLSLSNVVSTLLRPGEFDDPYTSAGEVGEDLEQMLDDPDRFLFDMDPEQISGQLEFPAGRLYGRDREVATLIESYNRVILSGGRSEMVLVSGYSGTGKSALVQQVRDPLLSRGGHFLHGKFDQLRQAEPLSAIVAAFTGYCEGMIRQGGRKLETVKAAIQDKVGADGANVLMDMIPSLRQLLSGEEEDGSTVAQPDGDTSTAVQVGGVEAQNRLRVVFRAFAAAIASEATPIVLFLDDLQWADISSLELIRSLVTDATGRWVLFVGCYRDNEVKAAHPLAVQLREIQKQSVPTVDIKLDNIGEGDLNDLISDTLHVSRRLVRSLTDIVHRKTSGNPFFVIQFLKSLCGEGLLYFSFEVRTWHWRTDAIESKIVGTNAVELMKATLLKLSANVRSAMEVAACLGSSCEETILRLIECEGKIKANLQDELADDDGSKLATDQNVSMAQMLDVAVTEGLMIKGGSRYRFAHDQIQLAAYSLIPKHERGILHLRIGSSIWREASATKLEELLFIAVDQLNCGSDFVKDKDERLALARLNLRAGKKALLLSSFVPAAKYLEAGIQLLGPGHWESNYELSLELYESCAESEYCSADISLMMELVRQIFDNAKCFKDKLRAYSIFINALGAQGKAQEAIETGFAVLENLGEAFPDEVDDEIVLADLDRTKHTLDGHTDEQLVTLKLMEDEQKIAAMRLLYQMVWYTYASKPELLPLVTFRLMRLSLSYGVCEISAFAFAMYGLILCGSFHEIERGYQFGQFALSLLDRFKSTACLARVYAAVFGCINNWKDHIRLSLDPALYAYQVGMRSGDIEFAMLNAQIYCVYAFQCGNHLAQLEEEMRAFCEQMREYKQEAALAILLPFRQTVLNLMGRSYNPLHLTGEAMDREEMLRNVSKTQLSLASCFIDFCSMWLAYIYSDYNAAAGFADKTRDVGKLANSKFEVCNHAFIDGLTSLALGRRANERKWTSRAKKAIVQMKDWATHAPCNCDHKVALMEAEYAFLEGENFKATDSYEKAIALACENGFVHEQALACERAGMFHQEAGDTSKASYYYDQAHSCYLEWGSQDKASHVRNRSLSLLLSP